MHNGFKVVSLSYKQADIKVREMIALQENHIRSLLRDLREVLDLQEALVLSTCNRTEVYYNSFQDRSVDIVKLLALTKGVVDGEKLLPFFKIVNDSSLATEHLFRVSIGLEAQVMGDMQIANQVKNAYQWAAESEMAGPFLHRLMHTIFFTSKRVVQETAFRDGAASVSYASADLIGDLTKAISDPKVLVVGLGEIGGDVCRHLMDSTMEVTISNRTLATAEDLAEECGMNALPFEEVLDNVHNFDVIVSAVAVEQPLFTKDYIESLNDFQYKFFLDLSVPRSIEKEIEELPGIVLYNVDNIHAKTNKALQRREAAIPKVEGIIDSALTDFNDWSKEMVVSPTIKKLKEALESIRQEEVDKFLKEMNEHESKMVDKVTQSMMQKVLKLPVLQLKAACKRGEADTLIDVLNDLFNLEAQAAEK